MRASPTGDREDATGRLDGLALLQGRDLAEHHRTDGGPRRGSSARPRDPLSNSSSSFGRGLGEARTRAMPSPTSSTWPTLAESSNRHVRGDVRLERSGDLLDVDRELCHQDPLFSFFGPGAARAAGRVGDGRCRRSRGRPCRVTMPPSTSGSMTTLTSTFFLVAVLSACSSSRCRRRSAAPRFGPRRLPCHVPRPRAPRSDRRSPRGRRSGRR